MITVAPPTHTFGTIHTERNGQATLFLANPTFADAEWSLSHIPEPPPKKRQTHSPGMAGKGAGVGKTPPAGLSGGVDVATSSGPLGKLSGRGVALPSSAGGGSQGRSRGGAGGGTAVAGGTRSRGRVVNSLAVDDPSVFVFCEKGGVIAGVKLPLKSSAACLPEDWNRLEVCTNV